MTDIIDLVRYERASLRLIDHIEKHGERFTIDGRALLYMIFSHHRSLTDSQLIEIRNQVSRDMSGKVIVGDDIWSAVYNNPQIFPRTRKEGLEDCTISIGEGVIRELFTSDFINKTFYEKLPKEIAEALRESIRSYR